MWYRSGGLYVIGLDHKSGEIRTFAVDRIVRLEATPRRFEVRKGFDFDDYIGSSFGVIAEPAIPVRIRFDRRWAGFVREHIWHRSQEIVSGPAGSAELRMQVGGTAELRTWILSFGSGAEVLEPESLRREVQAELEAATKRYAKKPTRRAKKSPAPRPQPRA